MQTVGMTHDSQFLVVFLLIKGYQIGWEVLWTYAAKLLNFFRSIFTEIYFFIEDLETLHGTYTYKTYNNP